LRVQCPGKISSRIRFVENLSTRSLLIQEADDPGGEVRWGKRVRRPVAHRAVEDQKREEDYDDGESEIDKLARELDPFSDQAQAMAQQRDGQKCELTVKPYMFGQKQESADKKDGMADPQLPFPQADQQESRRQKHDEVLQRGDQSLDRHRGEDEKVTERDREQFHNVQMLIGGVLEGRAEWRLDEFYHARGDEDGVKYSDQKPIFFFTRRVPDREFSELSPEDFREVGEDDQEHHRVFDPVDIGPEDPQQREEPYLVPLELQDVEKNDDEKVGKEVWPHRQFPAQDRDRAGDAQEKAEQQFRPVLVPADQG